MPSSRLSTDLSSFRTERDEYLRNERTSKELEGADRAWNNANQWTNKQASLLMDANEELVYARELESRTEKKLQRQRSKSFVSKLFPKASKEKHAKYKRDYTAASERAAAAEARSRVARKSLEKLEQERQQLRTKAVRLQSVKSRQKEILENVFQGTAKSEEESRIIRELHRVRNTLSNARQSLQAHSNALQLLQSSKTDLEFVTRLLRSLQASETQDELLKDSRIDISGVTTEMIRKNAKKLARSAQKKVSKATHFNPVLPLAKQSKAGQGMVSVFMDAEFDHVHGNPYGSMAVEKATMSARNALGVVNYNILVQNSTVENAIGNVRRLQHEMDQYHGRLVEERARILKESK